MATEEEVELIIRSAYQSHEDINFACPTTWKISQVKEHVRNILPNKPPISTQRLIFSGASLQDEQILSDILKERSVVDGAQIFHLVCSQPYVTQNIRQRSANPENTGTPAAEVPAGPVAPPTSVDWNEWWTNYSQNAELYNSQYQNYYQQWMQYYASIGYYSQHVYQQQAQPVINQHRYLGGLVSITRINYNQNPQVPNAQQIPNPPQENVENQQNPVAPVPGERVDALELFYRLFKLILLFSAVLLYSSFERFAVVLTAALFVYFIQLRRNQARNQAAVQAREAALAAAAAAAAAAQHAEAATSEGTSQEERSEEETNEERRETVNNNNTGENETNGEAEAATNAQNGQETSGMQIFLGACYSFITSFFASLVPDHPMPMDLN